MPAHARAGQDGRGHRFAAYPRCSTDPKVEREAKHPSGVRARMSVPLLVASVVAVLLGVAHSYLGERYVLVRLLRRDDLPRLFGGVEFTKGRSVSLGT